ncbi:MAG: EamA family transporter [Clostridia bacterium]|nr:EamA family transporter [Clostridia bacterium]
MNIGAMLIFGTLGIFIWETDLPSSVIAMLRAVIGTASIGLFMLVTKQKLNFRTIRSNALCLLISGVALGFNWILLFEAYRYTTISVATLCYYMAPVFVVLLSPIVLKEKLTVARLICSAAAILGAVLISGATVSGGQSVKGILFGLLAAVLYCGIILTNKFIKNQSPTETTFLQLLISAVIMILYVFFTESISVTDFNTRTIILVLVVGIIHTGFAYVLYFGSVQRIPAQTAAVFSYIDPVSSIILSALILNQTMTPMQIAGTVLILGATLFNELFPFIKAKINGGTV